MDPIVVNADLPGPLTSGRTAAPSNAGLGNDTTGSFSPISSRPEQDRSQQKHKDHPFQSLSFQPRTLGHGPGRGHQMEGVGLGVKARSRCQAQREAPGTRCCEGGADERLALALRGRRAKGRRWGLQGRPLSSPAQLGLPRPSRR